MKRMILQSPLRTAAVAAALGFTLIAVVAFSANAKAWLKPAKRPALVTKNPDKVQPQAKTPTNVFTERAVAQPGKERIGSEVISISRFGFETTELTRPHGKFFLFIENRSGLNPITLLLTSEQGERVVAVTQPPDQLDWADELNLHPGHYTLTVAERPAWVCEITITRP